MSFDSNKFPFVVIIPARLGSTRLPEKMLADIAGKPMIQRVYEQASLSGANRVIIATDDKRIADVLRPLSAEVVMTSSAHTSGTLRLAEVVKLKELSHDTRIINVQGDLPCLNPQLIQQIAANLVEHPKANICTLAEPLHSMEMMHNPNQVKVVLNHQGYALYFSRSPIPWQKPIMEHNTKAPLQTVYHHIGLYGYSAAYLMQFAQLEPSPLEYLENLEQLRALWYGHQIHVDMACAESVPGVDSQADLDRVRLYFRNEYQVL